MSEEFAEHRVPVQVQVMDLYWHFGAFLRAWVHSVDLYGHWEGVIPVADRSGKSSGGKGSDRGRGVG